MTEFPPSFAVHDAYRAEAARFRQHPPGEGATGVREREGPVKAITDTGVEPSDRASIGVRRRCSRTSGMKSTPF